MGDLATDLDVVLAAQDFWGVARVDRAGVTEVDIARGFADVAHGVAVTPDTRFGTASAAKAFTALAVMQLVGDGLLELATPAREVLGADLPLIADDVTVEHLLGHRSGIGDYLDEEGDDELDVDAYLMPVGSQHLATSEDYLAVLDGFPTKFAAGTEFAYCNGGFVVLAIIAERVSGVAFHELVEQRVCAPAGLARTAFLRSDELPGDAAIGYVDVDGVRRTNVFHLPVRGTGDGGIFTTTGDMLRFWQALHAGAIVAPEVVAEMLRPRSVDAEAPHCRYGLGFWLHPTSSAAFLEGADAGVSFRSLHDPSRDLTHTVISNTSDGAWPVTRVLAQHLGTSFS